MSIKKKKKRSTLLGGSEIPLVAKIHDCTLELNAERGDGSSFIDEWTRSTTIDWWKKKKMDKWWYTVLDKIRQLWTGVEREARWETMNACWSILPGSIYACERKMIQV